MHGDLQNFRGGIDAEGEPVADAVGNDECGIGPVVSSGPIFEAERAGADAVGEHDLPAVGVAGDDEGDAGVGGDVPTVRMMGEHESEH